jgi:hypothetical protein
MDTIIEVAGQCQGQGRARRWGYQHWAGTVSQYGMSGGCTEDGCPEMAREKRWNGKSVRPTCGTRRLGNSLSNGVKRKQEHDGSMIIPSEEVEGRQDSGIGSHDARRH